jgi:hypothetical protein
MLDVNEVIEGRYEPETMMDAMEAFVLLSNEQEKVNKGVANAFGYVLIRARNIYAKYHEIQEQGWNAETPWYVVAAQTFADEAAAAVAAGEIKNYTKTQLNTFKNSTRGLVRAMEMGAPLLERDEASGSFVLSAKNQIEKWCKEQEQAEEEARNRASAEARKALGIEDRVKGVKGESGEAETGSVLDLIKSEKVRAALEEYINAVADQESIVDENRIVSDLQNLTNRAKNFLKSAVEDLKKSAAGNKEEAA